MNRILSILLKQVEADPARAVTLLEPVLGLFGGALVPLVVDALPDGALKGYVEGHHDEALTFIKDAFALVAKHPDLAKSAAAQFAK